MAAAIKALNARIRANPTLDYFCSTHFWGPASNFGIPIAAIADTQKDPEIISGTMTAALTLYSGTFMRYALAVTPKNYLLFGCHVINFTSQNVQAFRFTKYWYMGGREQVLEQKANEAKRAGTELGQKVEGVVNEAKHQASKGVEKAKEIVGAK